VAAFGRRTIFYLSKIKLALWQEIYQNCVNKEEVYKGLETRERRKKLYKKRHK